MRAFIGLAPNQETKLAIEAWRNKAFPAFSAPVPAANFHVTLAFLGHISNKQQDALCDAVKQLHDIPAFDVSLNQLGYWAKPKALWLGCQDTTNAHLQLVNSLNRITKLVGLSLLQRDYTAHLTLARKCAVNPPAPLIPPDFAWHNAEFHLFESVSGNKGVSYPIRQTWPLANSNTNSS